MLQYPNSKQLHKVVFDDEITQVFDRIRYTKPHCLLYVEVDSVVVVAVECCVERRPGIITGQQYLYGTVCPRICIRLQDASPIDRRPTQGKQQRPPAVIIEIIYTKCT